MANSLSKLISLRAVTALVLLFLWSASRLFAVQLGYYPSWTPDLPPEKIDFRNFTHLVHAFVTLEDGAIHTSGNLPSLALTSKAHAQNVKVLLGLGGADSGPGFSQMAHDASLSRACVKGLVELVTANGYDGVDLDWEYPQAGDKKSVVEFVRQLRVALNQANPHALLTMAVPPTDYNAKAFDGPRLAPLVDYVQIMTYDLHGPWKDGAALSHSGYNSPLHESSSDPIDGAKLSFPKFVDYWHAKGLPKEKLLVGIPLYGHGFAVKEWGKTPTQAAAHPEISYREIQSLVQQGWVRHWDSVADVPWVESPAGKTAEIISYDDSQSAALKGRWAREAGVGGVFFWEISQDVVDGHNVLVEAADSGYSPKSP